MPIFGNKFSPKRAKSRKSTSLNNTAQLSELFDDNRSIKLNLCEQEILFQNGNWSNAHEANTNAYKYQQQLRYRLQGIEEENNMLKLKVEILLDMLTRTTAQSQLQQQEIERLKKTE